MTSLPFRKVTARVVVAAAAIGVTVTYGATAAFADTSQATAQAVNLKIGTSTVANSGPPVSASNDGTQGTVSAGTTPALSILGTQSTITAGLLAQQAQAFQNGTSAACAGLIGAGGQIQIGSDGLCDVAGGGQGGVTINLPNNFVLTATAILEECFAKSDGTVSAQSQLLDATLQLGGAPAISIPVNPAPSTPQQAGLLSLNLNEQTFPQTGEIAATALELNVVNTIDLTIGNVTCGPNAVTSATSVFPAKSLPIAAGTAAVLAGSGVLWVRRRRRVAAR